MAWGEVIIVVMLAIVAAPTYIRLSTYARQGT
ncbi:MAG: hypothetical protein ACJAZA_000689 [Shewanella psychromarinicola]|jgi:hypothetical protein